MQQYFVESSAMINEVIRLSDADDCFHLKKVMRAKIGTKIEIVVEEVVYECEVSQLDPIIELRILSNKKRNAELPIKVTIIQGLPKLDKMDLIIQKGTELGAISFIPWMAKRSIVKYDEKKTNQKITRWKKIAKEAAEQAHRNYIPEVCGVATTTNLLSELSKFDAVFIGSERLAKEELQPQRLMQQLQSYKQDAHIACVIGPEGGIDDDEFALFLEKNAIETTFGPRILRTETASLYFLSAVSFVNE